MSVVDSLTRSVQSSRAAASGDHILARKIMLSN